MTRNIIQEVFGTDLTPLQAKVLATILKEKVISIGGLTNLGFSEKTIRYLFRKWKQTGLLVFMSAGLYRINNNIAKKITPEVLEELDKLAAGIEM